MKLPFNISYGISLAILVTWLAALGWLFTKMALREFEPLSFIAWRFSVASIVLACLSFRQLTCMTYAQLCASVKVGACLGIAICVWVEGMHRIAYIGEAAFIVSLMVVIVPIISCFFGQRITGMLAISLLFSVIGLYLLTGANGFDVEVGQLILLFSAVLFSFHVVLSARWTKNIPAMPLATIQVFIVAALACVLAAFKGSLWQPFNAGFAMLTWSMLFCAALIATSLRFVVLTKSLTLLSANEASMVFVLGPIWTAFLGWLVLSEKMTCVQLIGCALIFLGQIIYRCTIYRR